MSVLKWLVVGFVALVLISLLAGRLGLLQGKPPSNLGVRDGRLKPPAKTPNSVSSQALLYPDHPRRDFAQIEPLPIKGDGPATLARLRRIVEALPGAQVVKSEPDYLYAQFTTPLMRFVDDVEFWFDPAAGRVQVRSASRVGHGDRGLNRARVEDIRTRLAEAP
ncbi:MAG: hypothetical protein AD742_07605 [Methylibium sp. NZG]|nr:MAG: hypothetical protein AD742_07605 [Methylibium sp. NZG]